MKKLFLISALFSLFFIFSCGDEENGNNPTESNDLYPLKTGNSWTYEVTSGQGTSQYNYSITGDTLIDGEKWYIAVNSANSNVTMFFRNADDGFHQGISENETPLSKVVFYKYPCSKGETFQAYENQMIVVSTDTTVTAGNEEFSCIQYRISNGYVKFDYFVSPGIGQVKVILANSNGNIDSQIELINYSLK